MDIWNNKINFSCLIVAIFSILFSGASLADSSLDKQEKQQRLIRALEEERLGLDNSYVLYYQSEEQYQYIHANFHHAFLAQDKNTRTVVVKLSPQEYASLEEQFQLEPAIEYRARRKSQLDKVLQSVSEPAIQSTNTHVISSSLGDGGELAESDVGLDVSAAVVEPTVNGIAGYSCYPTVEETLAVAEYLAASFPQYAELIDIGDSWEKSENPDNGFDLMVMKITNQNVVREKPVLFIQSAMHAREYTTAALTLDFARMLLEDYETNADINWLVDYHEIHILFLMNPDGRKIAENGLLKRKNTHLDALADCSLVNEGVDLNRNFSFFRGARTPEVGNPKDFAIGSDNQCAADYRGVDAASEPETQAVEAYARSLFADVRGSNDTDESPFDTPGLYLDIHSFGELILYPFSHTTDAAPNGEALQLLARRLAYFNEYDPVQGPSLYYVNGGSESIAYGELGVAHLTFELGNAFFEPCGNYESIIQPDNLNSLLHAAKLAKAPYLLPHGPYFEEFKVKGREHPDITIGADISFSAVAVDDLFREIEGAVTPGSVAGVEYSIDRHFYEDDANIVPLSDTLHAEDGFFDGVREAVSVHIDNANNSIELGQHTLYLRAKDFEGSYGAIAAKYFNIIEGRYLRAEINRSCSFNRCTFSAENSIDTDGDIQTYSWYIDQQLFHGAEYQYDFRANGEYTVRLEIIGEDGESATEEQTLTIALTGEAPVVSFNYECNGLDCVFDASETTNADNDLSGYIWNFGDGQRMLGTDKAIVSYTYQDYGDYQASLTVRDADGWRILNAFDVSVVESSDAASEQDNSKSSGGSSVDVTWLLLLLSTLLFARRVHSRHHL